MKKILFATTALVAFAGSAAYAQGVELTGRAEVGIVGGERYGNDTEFWTDVDVDFSMSGEADNGLTFGAELDIDETGGGMPATDDYGVSYFMAFGNMRMDAGDVDGGFDWAIEDTALAGGSIDDSETDNIGFYSDVGLDGDYDGQIYTFSYSFGDFGAALSAEVEDTGTFDPIWGLGLKYSGDLGGVTLNVGLGYQQGDQNAADTSVTAAEVTAINAAATGPALLAAVTALGGNNVTGGVDGAEAIGISIGAEFSSGFSAVVNYQEASYSNQAGENTATESDIGIGIAYQMNALTLALNANQTDNKLGVATLDASSLGFVANYDLGGGLVVQFGAGAGEWKNGNTTYDADTYSLGVAMTF